MFKWLVNLFRRKPIRKYGWKRDKKDTRDFKFTDLKLTVPPTLPTTVDLRSSPFMPPVYDQGQLGSCTANGSGAAFQFCRKKEKLKDWIPSRLFQYYNTRIIEATTDQDSGASIRDAIKATAQYGEVPETEWPYNIAKFAIKPPAPLYVEAKKYESLKYYSVDNTQITQLKTALAAGYPIVFGATVYESFENVGSDGIVPMPTDGDQEAGGHCMCIVGYNDSTQQLIVRNSWGTSWGLAGYCLFPYAYLTNGQLANDFWIIQTTTLTA